MVTDTYTNPYDLVIDRKAVLKAFQSLRKDKILARANHWCCQSCGSSDLEGRMETKLKSGAYKWKGYAFWHRQTEERAFGYCGRDTNRTLNIYYIGRNELDYTDYGIQEYYPELSVTLKDEDGLTSEEVGYAIYNSLKGAENSYGFGEEGLNVLWDGSADNSIQVFPRQFNEEVEMQLYGTFGFLNPDSPLIPDHLRDKVRESRNAWLEYSEKWNRDYKARQPQEEVS